MKRPETFLLVLTTSFLLSACGGSSSSGTAEAEPQGEAGGEEHAGHHPRIHPSLAPLHDVLAPTWHAEPGATRAGLACTNAAQLDEQARALAGAAVPEGADAAAWAAGTESLTASAAALVAECGASGPAVEERLGAFHDAFHVLLDLTH